MESPTHSDTGQAGVTRRRPQALAPLALILLVSSLLEFGLASDWIAIPGVASPEIHPIFPIAQGLAAIGLLAQRVRRLASLAIIVLLLATSADAVRHRELASENATDSDEPSEQDEEPLRTANWDLEINMPWAELKNIPLVDAPRLEGPIAGQEEQIRVALRRVSTNPVPWHIRLARYGLAVSAGRSYALRFRAKADSPRPLTYFIGPGDQPDISWTAHHEIRLAKEWRDVAIAFTAGRSNARLCLDLGQAAASVDVADVSIEELGDGVPGELSVLQLESHGRWSGVRPPDLELPRDLPRRTRVHIYGTTAAKTPWHIQLNAHGVSVKRGHRYRVSFRAHAERTRSFYYGVAHARAPFTDLGLFQRGELSEQWRDYSSEFTAIAEQDHARLLFDLGEDAASVEIQRLVFTEQTTGPSPATSAGDSPKPAIASTLGSELLTVYVQARLWVHAFWIVALLYATRPWRADSIALFDCTTWLAGAAAGWILVRTWFGDDNLTLRLSLTVVGCALLGLTWAKVCRLGLARFPVDRQNRFLFLASFGNLVALMTAWTIWTTYADGASVAILLFVPILILGNLVRLGAQEAAAYLSAPPAPDPNLWRPSPQYWIAVSSFGAVLTVWNLWRHVDLTLVEVAYIVANRMTTYAVVLGFIHLVSRLARVSESTVPRHVHTALASLVPLVLALDFLSVDKTETPLVDWARNLFDADAIANVESLWMWSGLSFFSVALVGVCILGVLCLMRLIAPLSGRRLPGFVARWSLAGLVAAAMALAGLEAVASSVLNAETEKRFDESSSLRLFDVDSSSYIEFQFKESPPPDAVPVGLVPSAVRRPDIFLFVVESLRSDALSPATTPRLAGFKSAAWSADLTVAGSNSSEYSWFSLLQSKHALRWTPSQANEPGAYPLRVLKRLGYRLEVRLSGDHRWRGMATQNFGSGLSLADSFVDSSRGLKTRTFDELDRIMMDDLLGTLRRTPRGGTMYVQELMSTHWSYAWPSDYPAPMSEYAPSVDFMQLDYSPADIQPIRNRYVNATSWVDKLFGDFEDALKAAGRYGESLIIVVGDHGEDFYEEGRWAHGTNLCRHQIEVPILIKFPASVGVPEPRAVMGHVDVMPTVLDLLKVDARALGKLDGTSAFRPRTSILVSNPRLLDSASGLVFLNHETRAALSWASGGQPSRLRIDSWSASNDSPDRARIIAYDKTADDLRGTFPELVRDVFSKFGPSHGRASWSPH